MRQGKERNHPGQESFGAWLSAPCWKSLQWCGGRTRGPERGGFVSRRKLGSTQSRGNNYRADHLISAAHPGYFVRVRCLNFIKGTQRDDTKFIVTFINSCHHHHHYHFCPSFLLSCLLPILFQHYINHLLLS